MALKQFIFKGVSAIPDDSEAQDGMLRAAVNMSNDGTGLRMLECPQTVLSDAPGCRYIHQNQNEGVAYRHYIMVQYADDTDSSYSLSWRDKEDATETMIGSGFNGPLTDINALGNTLIVNDADGMHYFLWGKDSNDSLGYIALGNHPPELNARFTLSSLFDVYPGKNPSDNKNLDCASFEGSVSLWDAPMPTISGDTNSAALYPYKYLKDNEGAFTEANMRSTWLTHYNATSLSLEDKSGKNGLLQTQAFVDLMTTGILSNVNTFINDATKNNLFVFPFFVRAAYVMFDGSLMMHTYPVLMIPNSRGPVFGLNSTTYTYFKNGVALTDKDLPAGIELNLDHADDDEQWCKYRFRGRVYGFKSRLRVKLSVDTAELAKWKDLVRGIGIYVTPSVYTYDQAGKVYGWSCTEKDDDFWNSYYSIGDMNLYNDADIKTKYADYGYSGQLTIKRYLRFAIGQLATSINNKSGNKLDSPMKNDLFCKFNDSDAYKYPSYVMTLPEFSEGEIKEKLQTAAQFFQIKEIEFDDVGDYIGNQDSYEIELDKGTLTSLPARLPMESGAGGLSHDDYHTHDVLSIGCSYVYNHRLNIGNVVRSPHNPLPAFSDFQFWKNGLSPYFWKVAVYLKSISQAGETIVVCDGGIDMQRNDQSSPMWFFYPDRNAYKARLFRKTTTGNWQYTDIILTQHTLLEGSYWLNNLWDPETLTFSDWTGEIPTSNGVGFAEHSSVYTSNIDNPFTFSAENINTQGDGTVRAMCANTEALGASQFGEHPMYCFTSLGVWAMKPNSNGGWLSVQPITRDVITEGVPPIGTDRYVLFCTSRGMMAIAGTNTRCLTDLLNGENTEIFERMDGIVTARSGTAPLLNIINGGLPLHFWLESGTRMLYDYRNNRVYVGGNTSGTWVLNLKEYIWTQSQTVITTPLNSYPEAEFVQGQDVVTTDTDERYTCAALLTRPIKTGGIFYSKVRSLVADGFFTPHGEEVYTALFGTRDWRRYKYIASSKSRRITRYGGSPYKAHSVLVTAVPDKPKEFTLVKVVADIIPEQTDRLR